MEPITYEQFRRLHPAVRCLQHYTHEQRAQLQASRRVGPRQRRAIGEYYYVHDMVPNLAFPTAKAATMRAYAVFASKVRIASEVPAERVRIALDANAEDEAAAQEAIAEEARSLGTQRAQG